MATNTKPIHRWRDMSRYAAVALAYAALSKLLLGFYAANGLPAIFWPGAGLALAALLIGGRRMWPAVAIGAFVGEWWAGASPALAASMAAVATLEPMLATWLLARCVRFDASLPLTRDFFCLAGFGGLLSPAVVVLAWGVALPFFGAADAEPFWRAPLVKWMADALGAVVVAPLLLVWRRPPRGNPAQVAEAAVVGYLAFLGGQIIFLDWFADLSASIRHGYWMYLIMIWAASRLSPHVVMLLLTMATVQAMVGAAHGVGLFATDFLRTNLTEFWVYSMVLSMVGMSLATQFAERRRVAAALGESEERLRLFIEHAPVALAMFDLEMRYLAVSDRWLTDYQLERPQIIGRSCYDVSPAQREYWQAAHRRALAGDVVKQDEERIVAADGTCRWLRWEARPWLADEGSVGGIVFFSEDISDRKRAEQAVVDSEAQYRAVIETVEDGFWIVDDHGRLLAVNEAYVNRSGYLREELLAMSVADLEGQESTDEVRAHVARVREKGSDRFETWHRAKSGERWPVEINTAYWANAGGRFFVFLRDITERKRNQAVMQTMESEMEDLTRLHIAGQTVAAMAHELNQPLNAVVAYAEAALRMLDAGNRQPQKLYHALESSARQAQRAGHVVRELLNFLNKGEVEAESLDINEAIRNVLRRLAKDGFDDVDYRLDLAPDLSPVRANSLQLEKVLLNLIENGIEAMSDNGINTRSIVIRVRTARDSGLAQVTVTDSGPGIDGDTIHRIFAPFFTTKPKGLGMGLAICRAIVEAHGGQLWVDSEPGAGASFHFTLPFAQ